MLTGPVTMRTKSAFWEFWSYIMPKFMLTVVAGIALCGAGAITGPTLALPIGNLAATSRDFSPIFQHVAYECSRYWCWGRPSYYDTPDHLRPRTFYGYAPHRHGDWFEYLYGRGRSGYRK